MFCVRVFWCFLCLTCISVHHNITMIQQRAVYLDIMIPQHQDRLDFRHYYSSCQKTKDGTNRHQQQQHLMSYLTTNSRIHYSWKTCIGMLFTTKKMAFWIQQTCFCLWSWLTKQVLLVKPLVKWAGGDRKHANELNNCPSCIL